MAVTVRWAVPRSWVELSAVTVPSRLMVTVHSLFWAEANPPQVWIAMPMPCLTVPLPWPGGCHFSFHPESLTARSSCSL